MVQEPFTFSSAQFSPKKTPKSFNFNSPALQALLEAPKTPGPVQAKPPGKMNFDFGSHAPPSFGTTTPQEAPRPSKPMQKQKAPMVFDFTTGNQAPPLFGSTTPKEAPKTSGPAQQQQKAPKPKHGSPQQPDFNAMIWCSLPDAELKKFTWQRFTFSNEDAARVLIWGHPVNASPDLSIKLRPLTLKQQEQRRNVKEELNRVATRFKHAAVVLILQADLAKTKRHTSIAPLLNEVFTFIQGAGGMTRAVKGVVVFKSEDAWYNAAQLSHNEIIAEPAVCDPLKTKYDKKTMADLQLVWLANEKYWVPESL
jgi:hypothetical protein